MSKSDLEAITLYLHKYKLEALESLLDEQGTDVQDYMQERLIELYAELVPFDTQQKIRRQIDKEKTSAKNAPKKEAER